MAADGVPAEIIGAIKDMYNGSTCTIRVYGRQTRSFSVETGVKQGCLLSPMLFNIMIDWITSRTATVAGGVLVGDNFYVADLDYADDLTLIGEDAQHSQLQVDTLDDAGQKVGLQISGKKTKTLPCECANPDLQLRGEPIENVDSFTYLGSCVNSSTRATAEVKARFGKATGVFYSLDKPLWARKDISLATKMRVFNTAVMPVLLFASETWTLAAADVAPLEVFQARCLRHILGVTMWDRMTNKEGQWRCGQEPVAVRLRENRLRWLGHVFRMGEDRFPHRSFLGPKPAGWRRPAGGGPKTWRQTVEQDLRNQHFSYEDARTAAQNRKQWRGIVNVSKAAPIAKSGALPYRR
jgi:hypothetical protein